MRLLMKGFKDEMIDDVQENENTEISLSSKKSSPSTIKTTEIVPVQCSYCQNTNSTASANDDILTCSSCNSNGIVLKLNNQYGSFKILCNKMPKPF